MKKFVIAAALLASASLQADMRALMRGIENSNMVLILAALGAGANVNQRLIINQKNEPFGTIYTYPLIEAVRELNSQLDPVNRHSALQIIQVLLEEGADPNAANAFGMTPLLLAIEGGSLSAVKLLMEFHANPYQKSGGTSPALLATGTRITRLYPRLAAYMRLYIGR